MTPFLRDILFGFFCCVLVTTRDEFHHAPCKLCIFLRKDVWRQDLRCNLKTLGQNVKTFKQVRIEIRSCRIYILCWRATIEGFVPCLCLRGSCHRQFYQWIEPSPVGPSLVTFVAFPCLGHFSWPAAFWKPDFFSLDFWNLLSYQKFLPDVWLTLVEWHLASSAVDTVWDQYQFLPDRNWASGTDWTLTLMEKANPSVTVYLPPYFITVSR